MPASPVLPTEAVLFATAGGHFSVRQGEIVAAIAATAPLVMPAHGITIYLRVAHFLAQIAHESDRFRTTEEYGSGAAYEGREDLGNTEPGDGTRFKGRGLLMLTGRANYARMSRGLGIDLVSEPERAGDAALSLDIAGRFWTARSLNGLADDDDIQRITKRINGGDNGLADRVACLGRARAALVQQRVIDLGRDPGPIDGDWGPLTTAGVLAVLTARGLPADTSRTAAIRALWED